MGRSILMFCSQFRPLVGGAERQAEKLARGLVAAGFRVTLLTLRWDASSPDLEEVDGVRIERIRPPVDPCHYVPVRGISLLSVPYRLWRIARAVRSRLGGYDLLHCHLVNMQTVGAALGGWLGGVPVLCKVASADDRCALGEIERTGINRLLVAPLGRRVVSTWIATTAAVEARLLASGVVPERIVRIPNGVETPGQEPTRATGGPVRRFLHLGRLSTNSDRDVPTLIRAFERLAAELPDVQLAVVGSGDRFDETLAVAKSCKASERIHLPGFDDSEKWLAWAQGYVQPSRREGLSNALLEAMARGLPCIANDIPPNREVLGDGAAGHLVPLGDETRLYQAMARLATDRGHAARLGRAAAERVCRCYTIESVVERYIELYERLLSQKG